MAEPRICKVCGQEDLTKRWDEDYALQWVEDCLRWQGEVLHGDHAHYCFDWDGLPVDETTPEHECCHCFAIPKS